MAEPSPAAPDFLPPPPSRRVGFLPELLPATGSQNVGAGARGAEAARAIDKLVGHRLELTAVVVDGEISLDKGTKLSVAERTNLHVAHELLLQP